MLYSFWREILQSSIAWVLYPAVVCLFSKKVDFTYAFSQSYYNYFYRILAAIHSLSSAVQFFDVNIYSHSLLPKHFLLVRFRIPVTVKQTSYQSSFIFRVASIRLKWQPPFEAATFSQKRTFSEHLVVWNNPSF